MKGVMSLADYTFSLMLIYNTLYARKTAFLWVILLFRESHSMPTSLISYTKLSYSLLINAEKCKSVGKDLD